MIKLQNLNIKFDNFALKDINLSIKKGTFHTLLGPSGAGKSTILLAILGLIKPSSGKILLNNADITNLEVEKRGFGYVPQHLGLFPHLNVRENILYSINAKKLSLKILEPFIDELIHITNIKHLLHRMPNSLSGGEKQRIALVRALASKPNLLLLDEPFSALDITLKKELWMLSKKLQSELGITVLSITHDLNEAYFLSSDISIIIDGKLQQSAPKKEVFYAPKNIQVAKYLGIKNIFNAKVISKQGDVATLFIDSLNTNITILNKKIQSGKKITIAIRTRDVSLNEGKNMIEGEMSWNEFDGCAFGYFKPNNSKNIIEVISTKAHQNISKIYFPEDRIMVI